METETRYITCPVCRGCGEQSYGWRPDVIVGASLHYDTERRNWQPDVETCVACKGAGEVPAR